MRNNRYYISIVLRVICITLNCFVVIWFYTLMHRPATTLFLILLAIIQVFYLISYLNRINRDLANFLIFLQENDTTLAFSRNRIERSFKDITINLDKINKKIQEARIVSEQKHQYLQAVVEHVGVGLISFGENGDVELINETTKELLGMNNISNVSVIIDRYPPLIPVFVDIHKVGQLLVKIKEGSRDMELLVKSQGLRFNDSKIKLVSLQNIKPELEQKELEAWKKLIRILRHEIMNSITPITTLTTAIKRCFKNSVNRKPLNEITDLNIDDALLSAQVIEERSKGLINFVEKFRSITDVPAPKYSVFSIEPMFLKIEVLFTDEFKSRNIEFKIDVENSDLQLKADEHLIEQVLINLVKNSIEAILTYPGKIVMKALKHQPDSICIQVIDNGVGISPEVIDHIFMPSYSTKENGLGVGLSISKQIIQMHNGSLIAYSEPGKETVMEIILPGWSAVEMTFDL